MDMKESTTYQAVLDEGRLEGAKRILMLMAEEHLGTAVASARAVIEAINSREEIEGLAKKLLGVSSWEELIRQARRAGMAASPTYQLALEEGRVEEARIILLLLGRNYMGEPSDELLKRLETMTNLETFESMVDGVRSAASWKKLLSAPTRPSRQARKSKCEM